ncbi:MAG: hypothetical protein LAN63_10265 [Acidobacteriia bacterium]|nr:hypothetical protein [Terriglobia bacterium]
MVSKCANPGCSTPFLYLHEGRLFRFETGVGNGSASGTEANGRQPMRRIEFFWLCDHCAGRMTVVFEEGAGVKVLPLSRSQPAA